MPIYMKIDGVDGDVTAKGYERWIELHSFGWGLTNLMGGGSPGAGVGKAHFQDLSVTRSAGKGSPLLFLDCASGKLLPAVQFVMTVVDHDQTRPFYKVELENVLISSFLNGGDGGGDRPTESLSFNFAKILFTIYVQNGDGSVHPQTAGWDVKGGKPI